MNVKKRIIKKSIYFIAIFKKPQTAADSSSILNKMLILSIIIVLVNFLETFDSKPVNFKLNN